MEARRDPDQVAKNPESCRCETFFRTILRIVEAMNHRGDQELKIQDRQLQVLEELRDLQRAGTVLLGCYSQALMEKSIHKLIKEEEEKKRRADLVDAKRQQRWGKRAS